MIAFIPIKEISQRVPNKNFREFKNKPLYKHNIDMLRNCKYIEHLYIDTDSDIVYNEYIDDEFVTVYKRKANLIGHTVSVCDLIMNCIKRYNILHEWMIQIHVTSPFLSLKTIDNLCDHIISYKYNSISSCNEIQSRLWRDGLYDLYPINHNPMILEQTQDLPIVYEENSVYYAFSTDEFKDTNMRICSKPLLLPINFPENIDIDNEKDWLLAKKLENVF